MGRALVGPPLALMGRALVALSGPLWAGPLWAPLGPFFAGPLWAPHWALVGPGPGIAPTGFKLRPRSGLSDYKIIYM